jgi:DNA-binding NarL/FixJ family response regulator
MLFRSICAECPACYISFMTPVASVRKNRTTMKVFIVEDSGLLKGYLMYMLGEISGVEISGASGSAEEAVHEIMNIKPDMVILDIRLEKGNGIEVLQKVKTELPGMVVAVLTNYPYPQYREKCIELGADYFLDKSKEFAALRDIVERHVDRSPLM